MSHPTDSDFTAFLDERLAADRPACNVRVVRHLLAGCDFCKSRLARLRAGRFRSSPQSAGKKACPPAAHAYDQVFSNLARTLDVFVGAGYPADEPPQILLAELAPLAPKNGSEHQRMLPILVKWLVERSHSVRYRDPVEMLRWAQWARLAAESCSALGVTGARRLADLQARAWGQLGNALRVNGRLQEAGDALRTAQRYGREGTGELLLRGKLCEQMASLHIFHRRFDDARQSTEEASSIYEEVGERQGLARASVVQAIALEYAGQAEEAAHLLRRTLPLINGDEDPHLLHAASHNLILCHLDLGRPDRALSVHLELHDLSWRLTEPLILLRAQWEQGRLLRELGHLELAEAALLRTQAGFVRRGLAYEAALISMELANLYEELGRTQSLRRVATESIPILRALRIGRETLASLVQLQRAAPWH